MAACADVGLAASYFAEVFAVLFSLAIVVAVLFSLAKVVGLTAATA
jgi:hypothetical protein